MLPVLLRDATRSLPWPLRLVYGLPLPEFSEPHTDVPVLLVLLSAGHSLTTLVGGGGELLTWMELDQSVTCADRLASI